MSIYCGLGKGYLLAIQAYVAHRIFFKVPCLRNHCFLVAVFFFLLVDVVFLMKIFFLPRCRVVRSPAMCGIVWAVFSLSIFFVSSQDARAQEGAATDMPTLEVHGERPQEQYYSPPPQNAYQQNRPSPPSMVSDPKLVRMQPAGDKRDKASICDGERGGNPVVLSTGNKVEQERDFTAAGEMGLYLERTYNAFWNASGLFGRYWISNFDYSLLQSMQLITSNQSRSSFILQNPDGRRVVFTYREKTQDHESGYYENKPYPIAHLSLENVYQESFPNEGKWVPGSYVHTENNEKLTFAIWYTSIEKGNYVFSMRIIKRENAHGIFWVYRYDDDDQLQSVTDSFGHRIQFKWSHGLVTDVIDPAGNVYHYAYMIKNAFSDDTGRLTQVTLPGEPETTITYHYEDPRFPGALTGKSYNGVRYSTFAYDDQGRAIASEHAGGVEHYDFSYNVLKTMQTTIGSDPVNPGYIPPCKWPGIFACALVDGKPVWKDKTIPEQLDVTETSPLGRKTTRRFEGGQQTDVTGAETPHCAASFKTRTYDANGYVNLASDFEDNLTDFDYDPQGHLLKTVEAKGSSAERTTTYIWDSANNRQTSISVAGQYREELSYGANGRILTRTHTDLTAAGKGQQQVTAYTYTTYPNTMLASMVTDGPLPGSGDAVTQTYSRTGNLLTISDGAGHQTVLSNYNGLGQPGQITGPNGDVTQFTYDARGREVRRRVIRHGVAADMATAYDGSGNVASIQTPDGVKREFSYDAARRLLATHWQRSDGSTVREELSYNPASQVIKRLTYDTSYFAVSGQVIGHVDRLWHADNFHWFVSGWACAVGLSRVVALDIYTTGNALTGAEKIATGLADQTSSAEVAQHCLSGGSAYNFTIALPGRLRDQYGGQMLYVFGLAPLGYDPVIISGTGFLIPRNILVGGFPGFIHDANWNYSIAGWVCGQGKDDIVMVDLWVGGGPGVGTLLGTVQANGNDDGDKSAVCESGVSGRSFRFPFNTWGRSTYAGQSVYAVAKKVGNGLSDLNMADTTTQRVVPDLHRSVALVDWSSSGEVSYGKHGWASTPITLTLRNTGNVVWGGTAASGNTFVYVGYVGDRQHDQNLALPHPVAPGETVTLSWRAPLPSYRNRATMHAQMRVDAIGFGDVFTKWFELARNESVPPCRGCQIP